MTTPARPARAPATIRLRDCQDLLRERERTHRENVRTREAAHREEIARAREEEERKRLLRYRTLQIVVGALVVLVGKLLGADIQWPWP